MGWAEKTSAWICLTGFAESKLLDIGIPQEKIFIRPNFIDSSLIVPAERVGTYVIFLGRLSHEKGIWTLVRAFEQLKGIELKLVGTGPLENAIRSYVSQRNLQNIRLVGFKSGEEKWELLRNSLFVVVPSECYEMFPIAVLEAYVAGKPVVASDIGGLPYVVRDGKGGMLFRPGSVSDLIEKVRHLAESPAEIEAMGRYGRQLVETEYGPERAYDSLTAIFSAACGAGQAPKDNSGGQRQPDSLPSIPTG
jgi:glycosyltransferase involved in cell wall biosynthesis